MKPKFDLPDKLQLLKKKKHIKPLMT